MEQVYAVTGMQCGGCARKVKTALAGMGEAATVDFPSATARIVNPQMPLAALNDKLAEVGEYSLQPLSRAAGVPLTPTLSPTGEEGEWKRYAPLLLIVAYIAVAACANAADIEGWMRHFMAGFFLVFSFFKLLDVRGFAASYAMYDLIAERWKSYGLVYPFLELALGAAYLFDLAPHAVLWATLVLTLVSGAGVARSMMRGQAIRCACLGAVLNVPVSTVTLVEDLAMAAMALFMLVAGR